MWCPPCGSIRQRGVVSLLQVLEAEPGNVKALYRRAQGHLAEQDLVEAELDIRAALLVGHSTSSTSHQDALISSTSA